MKTSYEQAVGSLPDVRMSRRSFLKSLGAAGISAAVTGGGVIGITRSVNQEKAADSQVAEAYPLSPQYDRTREDHAAIYNRVQELSHDPDDLDDLADYLESEPVRDWLSRYHELKPIEDKRRLLREQLLNESSITGSHDWDQTISAVLAFPTFFQTLFSIGSSRAAWKQYRDLYQTTLQSLQLLYPEDATKPSADEMAEYIKTLSYLPPIGGKIVVPTMRAGEELRLTPTNTAEQQFSQVKDKLETFTIREGIGYSMSIQGKLPYAFKYAALALVLDSPFENDWSEPFLDAPWGEVAPLVHDANFPQSTAFINPSWNMKGRTDFIQRIQPVEGDYLFDETEQRRILQELRFFQRIGFACHAYHDTAPNTIPLPIREGVREVWYTFVTRMSALFSNYDLLPIADVPWFLEQPRKLKGWHNYKKRYEADWAPIQNSLIDLEQIKVYYPEIRLSASELIDDCVQQIDGALGLTHNTLTIDQINTPRIE